MNRRQFGTAMAALGLSAAAGAAEPALVERILLSRNGWMPNNDRLPVLLYRRAFVPAADLKADLGVRPGAASAQGAARFTDRMEAAFARNGWPSQWRNGIYRYHHYHSTAHEVLGFAAGGARVMLGGEGGHEITVHAGDVAVLPTGTGHCLLEADSNFLVIGAYPPEQHWDICRTAPDAEVSERMRTLAFPKSDPVSGAAGELLSAWRA